MFDFWLEWWLPAGYFGGPKEFALESSRYFVGHRTAKSTLNVIDFPRGGMSRCSKQFRGALPRDPTDVPTYVFWANQFLTNNQGIDLAGNPGDVGTNDHSGQDQPRGSFTTIPMPIDPAVSGSLAIQGNGRVQALWILGHYHDYASPFFMT